MNGNQTLKDLASKPLPTELRVLTPSGLAKGLGDTTAQRTIQKDRLQPACSRNLSWSYAVHEPFVFMTPTSYPGPRWDQPWLALDNESFSLPWSLPGLMRLTKDGELEDAVKALARCFHAFNLCHSLAQ
jgi:hypothetical protein